MRPEQSTGKKWHLNEVHLQLSVLSEPLLGCQEVYTVFSCGACFSVRDTLSKPSADYVPTGLELRLTSLTIYAKELQECLAGNAYLLINEVLRNGNSNQERLTENWETRAHMKNSIFSFEFPSIFLPLLFTNSYCLLVIMT